MTGFTVITTEGRIEYEEAQKALYQEHGVKLTVKPETAIIAEETGPVVAFLPYNNLVALEPYDD